MRCGSRDSSPGLGGRSRRENSCELHDQRVSEGDVLHVTITSATCANGLPGRFPASVSHGYDDYLRWSPRLVRSDLLEAWVGVTPRCWQLERKLPALTLQFKPLTSSSGSSILTHRYLGTVVLRISHRGGSHAVSTSGNSRGQIGGNTRANATLAANRTRITMRIWLYDCGCYGPAWTRTRDQPIMSRLL